MKIKFTLALLLLVALISFSFKSKAKFHPLRSFGAAAVFGAGYTGASFDNGGTNCSACHGGGIYNPTVTLELLNSSNVPVTSYTAGASYTVRLSIIAASGIPKFGFQIMNAKASDNSNINTWGTSLPTNVKNTLTGGGRNYIEHNTTLTNGILDIPWTAPIATTGTVNFYGVGNAVDGLGGSGGDNAVSTNLSIAESALPIKLINFEGKEEKGSVKLSWKTAEEQDNNYFNIEHSITGNNFTSIAKVNSKGNTSVGNEYEYFDAKFKNGKNFYRLKQIDFDGTFTYSPIVNVLASTKKITIYPNPVLTEILINNVDLLKYTNYKIVNQAGKIILSGKLISNKIFVSSITTGNYYLTISNESGVLLSEKFLKQ